MAIQKAGQRSGQKANQEVQNQNILKEDLKSGKIRSLYLFAGPEEYLKRFYADSIEKNLVPDDLKALNKVVLEGRQDVARLSDYCETLPVFSERKVVVVKDSGMFKGKKRAEDGTAEKSERQEKKDRKEKTQADEFSLFLDDIPPHTCLIFIEAEVDKRLKAVDAVRNKGLVVEFPFAGPDELTNWVIRRFKAEGKQIDTYTASQLVETGEQSMTDILNEISKLTAYLGDRKNVNGEDIERVCTKSIKARIFDLTDAIADKKGEKALHLLNDMIIMKEPVPKILYMITRQFRQILQVKLLKDEGNSPDAVAARLKLTPFIAGKLTRQAARFETGKLRDALEAALEFDLAVKTGRLADRMAAELMIIEFSKC